MDLLIKIWEIYFLDEEGNPIDHTEENHNELTFRDEHQAFDKYSELLNEGHSVELWVMG